MANGICADGDKVPQQKYKKNKKMRGELGLRASWHVCLPLLHRASRMA